MLSHASGDMYCGVPSSTPAAVFTADAAAANIFASPKSSSFTKSGSPSRVRQHHVVGLEIAMDHAGRVRRGERARDLRADVERAHARRARVSAPSTDASVLPLEVLHDVEVVALGRHAEVVDLDDVLVADLVDRLRLLEEPLDDLAVRRRARGG